MIKILSSEEISKAESILFNSLKVQIKTHKVPEYIDYIHERFPDKDPHHILGSFGKSKGTDLLILPVTRPDHKFADQNRSLIAIANLAESINLLQDFLLTKLR